ncbi:hypothetical protein [Desulfocurvibacter africanus]|uniref:Uncharacterized protein n=1 Tax=Desulfocurvibacter africanus subsp. africanus str. Walvis Bay TaxID=690850 RepID=F3Z477_DESAF|nr:hypothetical protein [Desulfocurvibacter africanus]EGJ51619.1 hypothetical protein Desaf_3329 [Desulfocurvibacter africanus subsp. africanus str. Walvis Bay]
MKMRFVKVLLKVIAAIALFGLLTMHLWNALMPGLFGLNHMNFLQATGLLILSRLLFGGFGVIRDLGHFAARHERRAIFESWHAMTPEQRAQCMAKARSRRHAHEEHAPGNVQE